MRAHLLGDLISRHAEDLRGRDGVDVLAGQKRLLHRLVVRDVREQPQLDLAVVRVDEHAAACWDEHAAEFAAELRARGDILQIRLGRAQTARRRDGHLEARVDAPVGRDDLQKTVAVGRAEFCVLAVLQNLFDDGILPPQFFEHVRVRRPAGLRLFAVRELQAFKEHLAELLGGIDVERPARLFIDVLLERLELHFHLAAEGRESVRVHAHARVLHAREYGAEGQLNLIIELVQLALLKFGGKGLIQRIDGAGIDVERRLGLGRVAEHRESVWI